MVYNLKHGTCNQLEKQPSRQKDRWHLLLGCHVGHQITDSVAVAKFIIIPRRKKLITMGGRVKRKTKTLAPSSSTYHVTSLTKWSLRAIPAPASKIEEWESPLKSVDTTCEKARKLKSHGCNHTEVIHNVPHKHNIPGGLCIPKYPSWGHQLQP